MKIKKVKKVKTHKTPQGLMKVRKNFSRKLDLKKKDWVAKT